MRQKPDVDPALQEDMSDCLEVVESLSQREKNKILSVLKKDEKLRQGQEKKISLLKREIQEIRMKGVLRAGDDQDKTCRRCRVEFGFLFNRGTLCPICRFKVCRNCQEFMFNGSWLCKFCYKQRQLKWMTGEWATFEQNPLRKWASGSDILRASFQLHPGPSIDVDGPQQNGRGAQARKNTRNGVAGGDSSARARVEAPRDGDQHKLSQLFDVLRPKKHDPSQQETQVRRVSTRRYHESDSEESSSSSDVENVDERSGHSSPQALSVTESEKDAQVGTDSPRLSEGAGKPRSPNSGRERPRPAPRSPKPAPRKTHSDTLEPVVRPKVRPERKSEVLMREHTDRLFVEETSRVTLSKSVDTNLGDNTRQDIDNNRRAVSNAELNLQKHVNKTKESLERKQEANKSESRSPILSDKGAESQLKKSKDKKHRKSADDLLESNIKRTDERLRKSENLLAGEGIEEPIIASKKRADTESAILMRDPSLTQQGKRLDNNANKTDISVEVTEDNDTDKQQFTVIMQQHQDDDIHIPVPRGGSPYSVSMDSLPSSHPSPTFNRSSIGGSSHADSSDTDSLSRHELGEHSGTESAQQGHDNDFVVEEISKIRFQRISKKIGSMGVVTKLAKSPRTVTEGGAIEIGERETQADSTNVGISEEGGGALHASHHISDKKSTNVLQTQPKISVQKLSNSNRSYKRHDINESEVTEDVLIADKLEKPKLIFPTENSFRSDKSGSTLIDSQDSDDSEEKEVFEEVVIPIQAKKPESTIQVLIASQGDKLRLKSGDDLSWFSEMEGPEDWYRKQGMRANPRHSSLISPLNRVPSETDSIENMIDEMVNEGPIKTGDNGRHMSVPESDGSVCVTPISPVPPEMYEYNASNETGKYRLTYISDDNILDGDSDEGDNITMERQQNCYPGMTLDLRKSLDRLLHNQGDMATSSDTELDYEVQEALKTKLDSMKSNWSSLGSLTDAAEEELSKDYTKGDLNTEFRSTVANLQSLYTENESEGDDKGTFVTVQRQEKYKISDTETTQNMRERKLQKADTLDNLLDNQQDIITDRNEIVHLDEAFGHILDERSEVVRGEQGLDDVDGILKEDVKPQVEDKPQKIANKTVDVLRSQKPKLMHKNSLDTLIDSQGDLIDITDTHVELNAEFVAALEQELDSENRNSPENVDIHSEFTYLGGQQSMITNLNRDNLYYYGTETAQVESTDHDELFRENKSTSPAKLSIRVQKSIPIGYLGQKGSDESSESDGLSVIEEEDELEIAANDDKKNENQAGEVSAANSQAKDDHVKGLVMKQRQLFEKQAKSSHSAKVADSESDGHVRGKIFTKARDMEKKVRGLVPSQTSTHAAERAKAKATLKHHDKFKRLHDHWVAVEHHEADILDLDDDDDEVVEQEHTPYSDVQSEYTKLNQNVIVEDKDITKDGGLEEDTIKEEEQVYMEQDHSENVPHSDVLCEYTNLNIKENVDNIEIAKDQVDMSFNSSKNNVQSSVITHGHTSDDSIDKINGDNIVHKNLTKYTLKGDITDLERSGNKTTEMLTETKKDFKTHHVNIELSDSSPSMSSPSTDSQDSTIIVSDHEVKEVKTEDNEGVTMDNMISHHEKKTKDNEGISLNSIESSHERKTEDSEDIKVSEHEKKPEATASVSMDSIVSGHEKKPQATAGVSMDSIASGHENKLEANAGVSMDSIVSGHEKRPEDNEGVSLDSIASGHENKLTANAGVSMDSIASGHEMRPEDNESVSLDSITSGHEMKLEDNEGVSMDSITSGHEKKPENNESVSTDTITSGHEKKLEDNESVSMDSMVSGHEKETEDNEGVSMDSMVSGHEKETEDNEGVSMDSSSDLNVSAASINRFDYLGVSISDNLNRCHSISETFPNYEKNNTVEISTEKVGGPLSEDIKKESLQICHSIADVDHHDQPMESVQNDYLGASITDSTILCHTISERDANMQVTETPHVTGVHGSGSDNTLTANKKPVHVCHSIPDADSYTTTAINPDSLSPLNHGNVVNSSNNMRDTSGLCNSIAEVKMFTNYEKIPDITVSSFDDYEDTDSVNKEDKPVPTITLRQETVRECHSIPDYDQPSPTGQYNNDLHESSVHGTSITDSSALCNSILDMSGNTSLFDDVPLCNSISDMSMVSNVTDISGRQDKNAISLDFKKEPVGICYSIPDDDQILNGKHDRQSEAICRSIAEDVDLSFVKDDREDNVTCQSIGGDVDMRLVKHGRESEEVCHSLIEGEADVLYRVSEDDDMCHSIDESDIPQIQTRVKGNPPSGDENNAKGVDKHRIIKQGSDDVFIEDNNNATKPSKVSQMKQIPLKRVSQMTKTDNDSGLSELPRSNPLFKSNVEIELSTESSSSLPPHTADKPSTFKTPGNPSKVRSSSSSSSIPTSPDLSTSSSIDELGFFKSEKLSGVQETPMITECTSIQDDSGSVVSGDSRGATPEHRRTDSGYSQSSLPSTLSTVTDRSEEEEDIDKVVANIHTPKAGSRGNLLSVFSDSRESIASYYSDAGDIAYSTVPVTGDILFSINYNYKTSMLEIGVKQCKDIAIADTKRNRSDPYVKTYLLPDRTRGGKRKTKIKKHTMNPSFDETLKYSISKSELENRTLWVTLWHSDRFGRNVFLGEVTINFDYYKFDDPSPRWYQLQERMDSQPSSMMVYKGDLSLCIRYVPADKVTTSPSKGKQKKESSKGQLEVNVKEARNLTAVRSNGFSDPFCKGYLLPERHKSSKQKTAVIKKDCNPVWNHTFIFEDVSLIELRERCLELTIWDYEKLSSNDFLGGVRLNLGTGVSQGKQTEWMDARGEEMSMWQAMLDRPNLWIDGALILRPNMDKRKF